jgi:para-aminobenzoate synthetase component 1
MNIHPLREIKFEPDELVRRLLSLPQERRLSLLDSCGARGGQLLIAGFDPFEIVETDALDQLDERLARHASPDGGLAAGACIATISYELGHSLERLRTNSDRHTDVTEPHAVYAFYDALVVHDYERRKTFIAARDEGRAAEIEATLNAARPVPEREAHAGTRACSNMTREDYLAGVRRIKEHIAAGDIYQANLTQQLSCALPQDLEAEHVFLRLRREHPAPHAAFIRRSADTVVSISPERFLRVVKAEPDRRLIEAWPIKGTRPRGADEAEDARLRAELLSSAKDRAENVMIVDLLRNDVGRVCRYGSVEVASLCELAEHPTLFHLLSKVRGTLRDGVTAGELLRAAFPCGSITGAPKIRAMEIIDEVETVPRALSMGAVGYFAFDGTLDLSVAIRTMTVRDGVARFNVGGGIVADSDPALEYEESLVKARALLRALGAKDSFT